MHPAALPFRIFRTLLLAIAFVVAALPAAAQIAATAGAYHLRITTNPAVIPARGQVTLTIRVTDGAGKPVPGVTIRSLTKMAGMSMGERENTATPVSGEPGVYTAPATFAMGGGYQSNLALSGSLGDAAAQVSLQTGESTAKGSGGARLPWGWILGTLAVIGAGAFVVSRIRRAGTAPRIGSIVNGQTVGAMVLLAVVVGGAVYAVNHFRRPGAMTPIDAQAMDMSYLPAPPGFVPVTLATATQGAVESTVTYTATVAAFSEQPILPRITGQLVYMPFYPGDKVKRGELLARLDTSQVAPEQAARTAAVRGAESGVSMARANVAAAEADVAEADAAVLARRGAVGEVRSMAQAARDAKRNAEARRDAADAQVVEARAKVAAAKAQVTYWKTQIVRSASLLQAGAIAEQVYARDLAAADAATADLREAQAQVVRMQADAKAQTAAVRQAGSQIIVADAKIRTAQGELSAQTARVRAAEASKNAATAQVGQAQAAVTGARETLAAAAASKVYARITAPFDALVAARNVPPGTLVNPGTPILTIARVDRVRVQASVAQGDLDAVRVGTPVVLAAPNGKPIAARVSAIVPVVDAVSRTGIVEAVIANPGLHLLPGQYLTMRLTTGKKRGVVRVPSVAVAYRSAVGDSGAAQSEPFVWVATASGAAGQYVVQPMAVQIGVAGGGTTEILTGLSAGTKVVTAGATYLKAGDTVATTAPMSSIPMPPMATVTTPDTTVSVTESGFEPASLNLRVGVPAHITFTRKTDATCATSVSFPDYQITKPLPLGKPVTITLTPRTGTFTFTCPMNMVTGKVIAQ